MKTVIPPVSDRNTAFEGLVADIAGKFMTAPTQELDRLIVKGQRQLVERLGLDLCVLWQFNPERDDLVCTHGWTRPGVPEIARGSSAKADHPRYLERVSSNEVLWESSIPNPAAVFPIGADGQVFGALSFGALDARSPWELELLDRLRLVAAVFGQCLARRQSLVRLEDALLEVERLRLQLAEGDAQLRGETKALRPPRAIAAGSAAVRHSLALVASVAPTDASVLLHGETGSGKELFALEIHRLSKRSGSPMVRVNCAAIPTALLESELFGRERGAYTGALSRQAGRFELAHGSTIFLDEIGELPLDAQAKLLRVLQEKTIERLGGTRTIPIDVRVIAATNRDLAKEVADRKFREDLFYRLNVFPIAVPPLRERVEDLPDLVWTFIDEFAQAFNKRIDSISRENMEALKRHDWPGNVRELRNLIERAVIIATSPNLVVESPAGLGAALPGGTSMSEVEALHIRGVLERAGWRVRGAGGAAELLRMNPTTLDSRMARLGIRRPAKPTTLAAMPEP